MGTYLQAVQSIVPSIQPVENGLNMVANTLQLKQSQYDSNYKSLNKIYGQYFYADLSRKDNLDKRDNTIKQIDFDLQRIAGIDLSLDQNVQQAMQVFKSFYDDQGLMKDMAWTKNFNSTMGRAQGLNKSLDPKQKEQWWQKGEDYLNYKKQEFQNATAEEALSFENPTYTPFVNVQKMSEGIVKDSGISIKRSEVSGNYIVTRQNGTELIEPLSKLLNAQLAADPSVKAVFDVEAYVERKNWSNQHAKEYGGVDQAENKYLQDEFEKIKKSTVTTYDGLKNNSKIYDAKIKDIKEQIKLKGETPKLKKQLESYEYNNSINNTNLNSYEKQVTLMNEATQNNGSKDKANPFQDVNRLRYIVDETVANNLFINQIDLASETLSNKDAEVTIKESQFALIAKRHSNRLSEIAANKKVKEDMEKLKAYYDKYDVDGTLLPEGPKRGSGKKGSGKSEDGSKLTEEDPDNLNEKEEEEEEVVEDNKKKKEKKKEEKKISEDEVEIKETIELEEGDTGQELYKGKMTYYIIQDGRKIYFE